MTWEPPLVQAGNLASSMIELQDSRVECAHWANESRDSRALTTERDILILVPRKCIVELIEGKVWPQLLDHVEVGVDRLDW